MFEGDSSDGVKQFNFKFTVFIPLVIVNDLNGHYDLGLASSEALDLVVIGDGLVVLARLGGFSYSADSNGGFSGTVLVQNFDFDSLARF